MIFNPKIEFPDRKLNRIHGYDYSEDGFYFITICTKNKILHFGDVENKQVILNNAGRIVKDCLLNLPKFCLHLEIDSCVVMPNHIHVIFVLNKYNENGGQTQRSVPTKNNMNINVGDDLRVDPHADRPGGLSLQKRKSISEITKNFKTYTSRLIHEKYPSLNFSWQRSFYDHVIRVEESLDKIREYILNNPPKWDLDRNNPNRKPGKYYFEY